MTVSAHDVARELRKRLPDLGLVQAHKLLYYCQGYHLARHGEPMFSEHIVAWSNGPVVAELWRAENRGYEPPPQEPLDDQMVDTIGLVVDRYGSLSGVKLIEMTHSEPPWQGASTREDDNSWDDPIITREVLKEFFLDRDAAHSLRSFRLTPQREKIIEAAIERKTQAG